MFEAFCFGIGVVIGVVIGAKNPTSINEGVGKIVEFVKSKVQKK